MAAHIKRSQILEGLTMCTSCKRVLNRTLLKRIFMARGSYRSVFIAPDGRQWNGRNCPDCKYATKRF